MPPPDKDNKKDRKKEREGGRGGERGKNYRPVSLMNVGGKKSNIQ